jgi:hypothetical protein
MNDNKLVEHRHFEWADAAFTKPVRVRTKGVFSYTATQHMGRLYTTFGADFQVEIDLEEIVLQAIRQAARTKHGKSRLLGGLIVAKRYNMKKIKEREEALPLDTTQFELIEEAQ